MSGFLVCRIPSSRLSTALAAILLFAARPAVAQTLGQATDDDISLWRIGGVLLLCLVLAVAAIFALRARSGYADIVPFAIKRSRRLQLVENLRIGHSSTLSIVACDGREMIVLTGTQSNPVIQWLPPQGTAKAPGADADP